MWWWNGSGAGSSLMSWTRASERRFYGSLPPGAACLQEAAHYLVWAVREKLSPLVMMMMEMTWWFRKRKQWWPTFIEFLLWTAVKRKCFLCISSFHNVQEKKGKEKQTNKNRHATKSHSYNISPRTTCKLVSLGLSCSNWSSNLSKWLI